MPSKILLIDDEADLLVLLSTRLRVNGYDVAIASSGEQGLQVVSAQPIGAILLDIMMPGLDGYEVLQRLKGDPATQRIPVIMVSAKAHANDILKAKELGAADYITKPIDAAVLLKTLRGLLSS
jgi:DNA-binding response OmpR family regulator